MKTNAKTSGGQASQTAHKPQAQKPKGATPRKTKASLMREMLDREGGASLHDLCNATGWQPHTVRAALSGLRKAGHVIHRTRDDAGKSIYRVTDTGGGS